MRQLLRRGTYLLILIVWLILMAFPIVAFLLAARGEIAVGDESSPGLRLFLLNSKDQQGIGMEIRRRAAHDDSCLNTSLDYILWEGNIGNPEISYCQCFDPLTGFVDPALICPEDE